MPAASFLERSLLLFLRQALRMMIYLGRDPGTGMPLMFGASSSKRRGMNGNAVDVYEFNPEQTREIGIHRLRHAATLLRASQKQTSQKGAHGLPSSARRGEAAIEE